MLFLTVASLLCLADPAPLPIPFAGDEPIVVSIEWLATHLRDPKLVLFEVGKADQYTTRHIPGALRLAFQDIAAPHDMSAKPMGLALELPSAAQLDSVLSAKGVSNDSRIVVYFGDDWVTPAARAVLTLEAAGMRGRVSFLDGGLPAWVAAGHPVTTEAPTVTPGHFVSHMQDDVVVKADWLNQRLKSPEVAVIDARDAGFYLDTLDNEMPRGGHIPGAMSIPYGSLVDDNNRLLDRATLASLFTAAGAAKEKTVVAYCHIGQQGSLVFLVARYLGYNVRLYDGSFQEWSERKDLPIEGANRSRHS